MEETGYPTPTSTVTQTRLGSRSPRHVQDVGGEEVVVLFLYDILPRR